MSAVLIKRLQCRACMLSIFLTVFLITVFCLSMGNSCFEVLSLWKTGNMSYLFNLIVKLPPPLTHLKTHFLFLQKRKVLDKKWTLPQNFILNSDVIQWLFLEKFAPLYFSKAFVLLVKWRVKVRNMNTFIIVLLANRLSHPKLFFVS